MPPPAVSATGFAQKLKAVVLYALLALAVQASTGARADPSDGLVLGPLRAGLAPGVDIQSSITLDALDSARSVSKRGTALIMLTELRLGLDLNQLARLPGLRIQLHATNHALDRINTDYVGALTGVTNIETVRNGSKIYRLWVERTWASQGTALRAGLFPVEDEFFTMEAASSFIHPTNGPQGDYAGTVGAAIYNHAGFGVRLRQEWADRSRYTMLAILDRPIEDTNSIGWNGLSFPRAPGLQAMLEVGLTPLASKGVARSERFDKTAAGIWAYSRGDEHLSARDAQGKPSPARSHGWYVLRERTLWTSAEQPTALSGFVRVSGGDARAYPVSRAINAGLRLDGWVPGRSADASAVMLVLQQLGEPWQQRLRSAGIRPAWAENVVEFNHRLELERWLAIMPLAQWISRPGGVASSARSRVLGVRFTVTL
jgi:carbohydrate-selective porin OprB